MARSLQRWTNYNTEALASKVCMFVEFRSVLLLRMAATRARARRIAILRPTVRLALLALSFAGVAGARPIVIEESQQLDRPSADHRYFAEFVAIDGDYALATALRSDRGFNYPYQQLALLYHRGADGQWAFERIVVDNDTDAASWNNPGVAMKNGIAAVSVTPFLTFRLTPQGWVSTPSPFPAPVGDPDWANGQNVRIDGSTLVSSADRCHYGAVSSQWQNGTWAGTQSVHGNPRICSLANYAMSLDIDGNTLVVTNPQEDSDQVPTDLKIYGRNAPGAPWQLSATLPTGEWGRGVAVRGDDIVVGSWHPLGNEIYRRGAGGWQHAGHLPTLRGFGFYYDGAYQFAKNGEFILFGGTGITESGRGAIHVYRQRADGSYEHVAILTSSTGEDLRGVVEISGRTVIASGLSPDDYEHRRLYFFELPANLANPAVVQDDFESGTAAGWTARPGSQLAVVASGNTRVYRQSSLVGETGAVLEDSDWTNQAVQADVRPTAFQGADRWFGLATRFADESNYYYVTLRSSGVVQLKRKQNGAFITLGSRALPVAANQSYRVRLESIGSLHRVFVDGVQQLSAFDAGLTRGRAALLTYRASADFDNVVLTPSPLTPILEMDFSSASDCEILVRDPLFVRSGTSRWDCPEPYPYEYLRQASLEGIARGAIGPVTDDQIAQVRVNPESFAAGGTQDKWVGVMARYTDEQNYYYLSLRSSNTVSLRKLNNGAIVNLGTAPFTVNPGTWYTLRLETVGSKVRAYVDGRLVFERNDASLPTGNTGMATYRAAARFDDILVYQP
jgi:hypothetical protein